LRSIIQSKDSRRESLAAKRSGRAGQDEKSGRDDGRMNALKKIPHEGGVKRKERS